MSARRQIQTKRTEEGIALLISIFILLLISIVAIALIVASGTESSLAGNYRSATGVYYAALSGLEEARGRLLSNNPDAFKTTDPANFLPPPGTALNMGDTYYLINPAGGEAITPWDSTSTYPDNQFGVEFGPSGFFSPTNPSPTALSVWNRNPLQALNLPGPLYKWVRVNAVSELSLGLDVAPHDGARGPTPVYYDGTNLNDTNSGSQVLEITSLAVLPNGSQKLVQYLTAPVPLTLPPFPAALTLAGSGVAYSAPAANAAFWVKGIDQDCNGNTGATFPAIGVFASADITAVKFGGNGGTGIPAGSIRTNNYPGITVSPDVERVDGSFSPALQTPSGLDAIAQAIIQNADGVIPAGNGSAQRSYLSNLVSSGAMSPTSPMTLVVNGDLDLSGWHNTGYGLLLVTGNLNYDPGASWNGIVMVVGQGTVTGTKSGSGELDGAFLVARTRDTSGNLLPGPNLGASSVDFNQPPVMGGQGIRYSSCWIQKSQPRSSYKILSFHEIAQ